MNANSHALPPGLNIQEYELVRVLGVGGFAVTYLAWDNNMERGCAIKEYLPNNLAVRNNEGQVEPISAEAKEEFDWGLDSFIAEAKTLAKFDHRNIVKVYRSFLHNGTGYIVMEYAEGDTFSEHLSSKGILSELELKEILLPVLNGLSKVHKADFLHRDIKPLNLIIRDTDGSGVLIDFGSARQAIGETDKHLTALVSGGYSPYEQYSSRGNQGPWTDIYALGALCYRALTGEDPYEATLRIKDDPLEPLVKRCKGKVSERFLKAIDKALNFDEKDRPQTIDDWVQEIGAAEAITKGGPAGVTAKPPSVSEASSGSRKTLLAAVAMVLVLGGGVAGWFILGSAEIGDDRAVAFQVPQTVNVDVAPFMMGDAVGDGDSDEQPVHEVTLASDFALSAYEVSFASYDIFAAEMDKASPSDEGWGREQRPVINVSWHDAVAYAHWLSQKTGETWRLPTEAEWEFVAKSGTDTNYPWGNEIAADRVNCRLCGNSSAAEKTSTVGEYTNTASGAYDVHGNVWEWVQDCAHDNYAQAPNDGSAWESSPQCSRVKRGGSWNSPPYELRSTYRYWQPADELDNETGFRLVREI